MDVPTFFVCPYQANNNVDFF